MKAMLGLVVLLFLLLGVASQELSPAHLSGPTPYIQQQFPIYREEFFIKTTSSFTTLTFLTPNTYIYNATFTVLQGATEVNYSTGLTWGIDYLQIRRSTNTNSGIEVKAVSYLVLPSTGFQFSITKGPRGYSGVTAYSLNSGSPIYVGSFTNSLAGFSESYTQSFTVNLNSLGGSDPAFVVTDTLRRHVQKQVYAFYYGWYGNPRVSGWIHWNEQARNGNRSVTGVPLVGFYDSRDPNIVDYQISLAEQSGVNGFISSWWGRGSSTDAATSLLLNESEKLGFNTTVYYETDRTLSLSQSNALKTIVSDLRYIFASYSNYPSFMRVGGIPAIFIYNVDDYSPSFWSNVTSQVKSAYPNTYIIGDTTNLQYIDIFDGFHFYGLLSLFENNSPVTDGTFTAFYNMEVEANLHNKLWFAPVFPGFNNINDALEPFLYYSRNNTFVYQKSWSISENSNPDGIVIVTWNEWHEGTNIEPANYFGFNYLRMTAVESSGFTGRNANLNPKPSVFVVTTSGTATNHTVTIKNNGSSPVYDLRVSLGNGITSSLGNGKTVGTDGKQFSVIPLILPTQNKTFSVSGNLTPANAIYSYDYLGNVYKAKLGEPRTVFVAVVSTPVVVPEAVSGLPPFIPISVSAAMEIVLLFVFRRAMSRTK